MRVAFVTPYLPCPANTGGRIRMYRLARALCRDRDTRVHLFACASVREARRQAHSRELALYHASTVHTHDRGAVPPMVTPLRVRRACPRSLARALADAHARQRFDVVVVAHSFAVATAGLLPRSVPWVVDEHNIESDYYRDYGAAARAAGIGPPRFDLEREIELLRVWERGVWARAALVTCVSPQDASVVRAHRDGPVEVFANGTALDEIVYRPPSTRPSRDILFVGLMAHAPNIAAARMLAERVMPLVWSREPDARLVLCGRNPTESVRALAGPRVEVTGTVDSVAPYLDRAAVYANALSHGAGTSLKVPEALAAGIPMVSTDVGVRGFGLVAGEHFVSAEGPSAFADALVQCLRAREQLDAQAERARAVAAHYDWDRIGEAFAARVRAVAS